MTRDDYDDYMQIVASHSGALFLQCRFDLIRYLKCDGTAVIVLAFLLNLLRLKDSNPKDRRVLRENDMWFKCPAKEIENKLGASHHQRIRSTETLKKYGLVDTDHRWGNILWVRVNCDKLREIERADTTKRPPSKNLGKNLDFRKPENPETGDPEVTKPEIPYNKSLPKSFHPTGGTPSASPHTHQPHFRSEGDPPYRNGESAPLAPPKEPARPKAKKAGKPRPSIEARHFQQAEVLHATAEELSGRRIPFENKAAQANCFKVMESRIPPERIDAALWFYREHPIVNPRTDRPLILTHPKAFEKCLEWIEDEMAKEDRRKNGRRIYNVVEGENTILPEHERL